MHWIALQPAPHDGAADAPALTDVHAALAAQAYARAAAAAPTQPRAKNKQGVLEQMLKTQAP